ncbi:hypothetical protein E4T61_11435 [Bacillus velezensis]|nr:hypothetical protein E4T61_11435 [Bacillus velezensis]
MDLHTKTSLISYIDWCKHRHKNKNTNAFAIQHRFKNRKRIVFSFSNIIYIKTYCLFTECFA